MTKNEIEPLLKDLEIIENKLINTIEYLRALENYFEKELNKSRRKKKMNE